MDETLGSPGLMLGNAWANVPVLPTLEKRSNYILSARESLSGPVRGKNRDLGGKSTTLDLLLDGSQPSNGSFSPGVSCGQKDFPGKWGSLGYPQRKS